MDVHLLRNWVVHIYRLNISLQLVVQQLDDRVEVVALAYVEIIELSQPVLGRRHQPATDGRNDLYELALEGVESFSAA